jgi:hypothetical protein
MLKKLFKIGLAIGVVTIVTLVVAELAVGDVDVTKKDDHPTGIGAATEKPGR